MHQTTVRFAPDVWAALDEEASRLGVSTAQYVREAAVARLAYGMGRRRDPELDQAIAGARSRGADLEWGAADAQAHSRQEIAVERSLDVLSSSEALWAQGKLARERAHELRERLALKRKRT
jgi:hypothetical protein